MKAKHLENNVFTETVGNDGTEPTWMIGRDWMLYWLCPNCGCLNEWWRMKCRECGWKPKRR